MPKPGPRVHHQAVRRRGSCQRSAHRSIGGGCCLPGGCAIETASRARRQGSPSAQGRSARRIAHSARSRHSLNAKLPKHLPQRARNADKQFAGPWSTSPLIAAMQKLSGSRRACQWLRRVFCKTSQRAVRGTGGIGHVAAPGKITAKSAVQKPSTMLCFLFTGRCRVGRNGTALLRRSSEPR
jgi:hypothetical protein